jgi:hypothetical protein
MFNRFLELLLLKKHNALLKQIERKGKPVVMFHEEHPTHVGVVQM